MGFELTVNAELRTSQAVMRRRVSAAPREFDQIINTHGGLQFQALLKLEHQPRFYHWIPLAVHYPGQWNACTLLELCRNSEQQFSTARAPWIDWIKQNRTELSEAQSKHMQGHNKQLNLALRLVRPFAPDDAFWNCGYAAQCEAFVSECRRLKPLIDFFQRRN